MNNIIAFPVTQTPVDRKASKQHSRITQNTNEKHCSANQSMTPSSSVTWILGKRYTKEQAITLKSHCKSILKFTYRNRFPAMEPYNITSDSGWGCMIRVAQMMMAQILIRDSNMGKDWRVSDLDSLRQCKEYCDIVRMFADYASPACPYAIHHLVILIFTTID